MSVCLDDDEIMRIIEDIAGLRPIAKEDIEQFFDKLQSIQPDTRGGQHEPKRQRIPLLRQYYVGGLGRWDISPVHPMSKQEFLRKMRGFEENYPPPMSKQEFLRKMRGFDSTVCFNSSLIPHPSIWSLLTRLFRGILK